ncbi:Mu transposase C-terminal domain-containing protein [Streptomyces sp. BE303]|uniref:Mu transposase C-terminal domain-containing protein n=1 Tax=Streptomyces sp. BE303 TaxID=3002528 RepID=UPI002E7A57FB|nr:Mu transposase C-terminal domain-containing protein [Streptomyces sp. BE303]MED7947411.1 Mu transposase C-terminal domain-containing protein [Streptomyces sp. BE303]
MSALQGARVHLSATGEGGEDAVALLSAVIGAADFAVVDGDGQQRPGARIPDVSIMSLLTEAELKDVRAWERHLREAEEGLPPGCAPGTRPRPEYDPAVVSRSRRLAGKERELRALGWRKVSVATLDRRLKEYSAQGVTALVRIAAGKLYGNTDERVVALLLQELNAGTEESSGWGNRLYERLQAQLRATYPQENLRISRTGFYRLLDSLGTRTSSLRGPVRRRREAASSPEPPWTPTRALMLGEMVQIDSTGLDVLAIGDDGYPVQVELTAAVDVASRSIIGALIVPRAPGRGYKGKRLGGRATTSFDATLMLAQALAPMPGRPGWSPLSTAQLSDLPYADQVACDPRTAGAAARPVIRPKMVVVDQGKIYQSEHFTDVCTSLGISVRSARDNTADDKAIVEATFSALKKLFCQYVAAYTARDLARRGKYVTDAPMWRLNELQDLLNEWIALHWQQHRHEGLRSPNLPALVLTPNQMYAALVACEGYAPLPLSQSQLRKLLLCEWRQVGDKGVRVGNRTYNSAALQEYNKQPSGVRGQGKKWPIRFDPYAPRHVWLFDQRKEQRGEDPWVEAEFIHQDLIDGEWSQYLWQTAERDYREAGGPEEHQQRERDIALAVSQLRERARQGPREEMPALLPGRRSGAARRRWRRPGRPFSGPRPAVRSPDPDRYVGISVPDPATVVPARSLESPAQFLFPDQGTGSRRSPGVGGSVAVGEAAALPGTDEQPWPDAEPSAGARAGTGPGNGSGLVAAQRGATGGMADLFLGALPVLPSPLYPAPSPQAVSGTTEEDDS